MREYIIYYQTVGSEFVFESKVLAQTLQDAVNIFRIDNPQFVVLTVEGPYDIR